MIDDPFEALACLIEAAKSHQRAVQALQDRPPVVVTQSDADVAADPRA